MSGPKPLTESPSFSTAKGSKKIFNVPRPQGKSEDTTIENTVILEVKLKEQEEMSRRIDLHRSRKDCKFRTPRSLLTFGRACIGERRQEPSESPNT